MDKRCSFLVLIGCLIERLPKTCVPSSKLCFVRLAIAKLTNFCSSCFGLCSTCVKFLGTCPHESYSRVRASILRDSPKVCRDESANQQMVTSKNSKIVHANVVQKCHGIRTWLQFFWGDRIFFGTCHTVEIARFFQCKNVRAFLLQTNPKFVRRNPIPWWPKFVTKKYGLLKSVITVEEFVVPFQRL